MTVIFVQAVFLVIPLESTKDERWLLLRVQKKDALQGPKQALIPLNLPNCQAGYDRDLKNIYLYYEEKVAHEMPPALL